MDFGKILDSWERHQPLSKPLKVESEAEGEKKISVPQYRKGTVKGFEAQEELDLHGLKRSEAQERLREFLKDAVDEHLTRLLIIHGKGLHSPQESVIPHLVRDELAHFPWVQEYGDAERRLGGTGATWIKLKLQSIDKV
ncbi:MAG: Smr/MutS family protein [Spirochaetales bacterium]|nr:Smr/MutS family protein [Spirochaetales bacterium]